MKNKILVENEILKKYKKYFIENNLFQTPFGILLYWENSFLKIEEFEELNKDDGYNNEKNLIIHFDNEVFIPLGNEKFQENFLSKNKDKIIFLNNYFVNKFPKYFLKYTKFDRNESEYVYKIEDLLALEGSNYKTFRTCIRSFEKNYNDYKFSKLLKDDIKNVILFLNNWYQNKEMNPILEVERKNLLTIIEEFDKFEVDFYKLEVNNNIIGLSCIEIFNEEYVISHIEKCSNEFKNSYQMLFYLTLNEYKKYKYLNKLGDSGSIGLRKNKLSYNPIFLLKNYNYHKKN